MRIGVNARVLALLLVSIAASQASGESIYCTIQHATLNMRTVFGGKIFPVSLTGNLGYINRMSVDLNVWSNHELSFSSVDEGLEMFALKTGKKPAQSNFSDDPPDGETGEIADIEYFTDSETLRHNFKKYNQIKIVTNFAYCRELFLYGKTVSFNPRGFYTRYRRWKKLVGGDFRDEAADEVKISIEYRANWQSFRKFAVRLTQKLGGDKIIYIDDNFQPQEDVFRGGAALESGMRLMSEIREPYEVGFLELCPQESAEKFAWFFEDII